MQLSLDLPADKSLVLTGLAQLALCSNLLILALAHERGLLSRHGAIRLGLILAEVIVIGLLVAIASGPLASLLQWQLFTSGVVARANISQIILLLLLPALIGLIARQVLQPSAVHAALLAAFLASLIAAFRPDTPFWSMAYMSTAALLLLFGLLQDSYRMAFLDELTGLRGRRSLQQKLLTLGNQYTIAMLDVDHFKQFNDTHGHDVGDQVLKMVASQMGQVTGGGTAYRYGGEEFTIVFPRKTSKQCIPHLSAVREAIEEYTLLIRSKERPRRQQKGRQRRGQGQSTKRVSVTVSIGVAECNEKLQTPKQVMEAADQALYRAKENGRNQISR
ncbi:MAG: GGDEF domain-containing protein [Gammaproteobacteria bacterium]